MMWNIYLILGAGAQRLAAHLSTHESEQDDDEEVMLNVLGCRLTY